MKATAFFTIAVASSLLAPPSLARATAQMDIAAIKAGRVIFQVRLVITKSPKVSQAAREATDLLEKLSQKSKLTVNAASIRVFSHRFAGVTSGRIFWRIGIAGRRGGGVAENRRWSITSRVAAPD